MKKYTVYLMSLLILAGIMNGALYAAAAPKSAGEEEVKVLAEADRKIRADLYASLSKQVLDLKDRLEQCEINKKYEELMLVPYDFFKDIMSPNLLDDLNIRNYMRREDSDIVREIRGLEKNIKELKLGIAQRKGDSWWQWFTRGKKQLFNFQNVSSDDIGSKTKEKVDLELKCRECENALALLMAVNRASQQDFDQKMVASNFKLIYRDLSYLRTFRKVTQRIGRLKALLLEQQRLERIEREWGELPTTY
jgi:hypothetical protein